MAENKHTHLTQDVKGGADRETIAVADTSNFPVGCIAKFQAVVKHGVPLAPAQVTHVLEKIDATHMVIGVVEGEIAPRSHGEMVVFEKAPKVKKDELK
jgi:hypothetical protein